MRLCFSLKATFEDSSLCKRQTARLGSLSYRDVEFMKLYWLFMSVQSVLSDLNGRTISSFQQGFGPSAVDVCSTERWKDTSTNGLIRG